MKIIWTLAKVAIGLAIAIPVGILALGLAAGLLGTMVGLAVLAARLAFLGLVGYGVYRLGRFFFGSKSKAPAPAPELPRVDPYYEAAMRELDAEFRTRG